VKKLFILSLILIAQLAASGVVLAAAQKKISDRIWTKAKAQGTIELIVGLKLPYRPPGRLTAAERLAERKLIAEKQSALILELAGFKYTVLDQYDSLPIIFLELEPAALAILERSDLVTGVEENTFDKLNLGQSVPIVGAPLAWSFGTGYDGTGWTIAIVDTGVDSNHPLLVGKIVDEDQIELELR